MTSRGSAELYQLDHALQDAGFHLVAGADEAGRGACAGPLVAAAVILDDHHPVPGLADSKLLTAKRRQACFAQIMRDALAVAWVRVEAEECDRLGIQEADIQGLRRALARLSPQPDFALTDGFAVDGLGVPSLAVWKGDRVSACVAAASIVAKVTRDQIMTEYDRDYPHFGFGVHKGYVTKLHQQRLDQHGPTPLHRYSYANVRRASGRVGQP